VFPTIRTIPTVFRVIVDEIRYIQLLYSLLPVPGVL